MRIFLVGFMGSGKSKLGRKLAVEMDMAFVDTDELIEKIAGFSVSQIFAQSGEDAFRQLESKLFAAGLPDDAIIATGGGFPCHNGLMDEMMKDGIVVYLNMSPKALSGRLNQSNRTSRPLIKGMGEAALMGFIERELATREVYYRKAHVIFDGIDAIGRVEVLIDKIRQLR